MKRVFYLIAALALLSGCADKPNKDEQPGGIYGVITDAAITGEPIRGASVQLSTGEQKTTGSDGQYEFSGLKAGDYTLQVTMPGYKPLTNHKITVEPGKNASGDVQLEKLPPSLRVVNNNNSEQDISELDFGADAADITRSFSIFNDGPEALEWDITVTAAWISGVSRTSGRLDAGRTQTLVVTIDREKLSGGENTTTIHVTSDNGSKDLTVKAVGEVKILPTLNTLAATNVATTTALLNGEILTNGTPAYTERGFVYSLSPMPTLENTIAKVTASLTTSRTYTATIVGLVLGETYYVRAYAVNIAGTAYSSNEVSFTTEMVLPGVTVQDITGISIVEGRATFNGTIVGIGDPVYTERGFVYDTQRNPTESSGTKIPAAGSGAGSFTATANELAEGNTYYVRAYAKNEKGYAYSATDVELNFNAVMPEPVTHAATNISATSATLNGSIMSTGDPAYIEKGFVYGTTVNPTIENGAKEVVASGGTGAFSKTVTGLAEAITYYARAYVLYPKGVVYGDGHSFNTNIAQITGMVTNQSGAGIANATLLFMQGSTAVHSATTNSSGAYSISNVAVGSYNITIIASGYTTITSVLTIPASLRTQNFSMSLLGKIIGTLKDDIDGIALRNVSIRLFRGSTQVATVNTNNNGEFTFSNLNPDNYSIRATLENYKELNTPITVISGDNIVSYAMELIVGAELDDGTGVFKVNACVVYFECNNTALPGTTTTRVIRIKNNRQVSLPWSITNRPASGITFSATSGTISANGIVSITVTFTYPNATGSQAGRQQLNLTGCSGSTRTFVWNWEDKEGGFYFDINNWPSNASYPWIQHNCSAFCLHNPKFTIGELHGDFGILFNQFITW